VALAVVAALLPLSWALAYLLGGASVVAPLWFLVPVILAGVRFGPSGALGTAVVATVVAGPLLPGDVATGAPQVAWDWVSRGVFFVLIGEFATYLCIAVRRTSARVEQAEAHALSEGEQRFRALVQRATDMITVIDAEGKLKYESPAVERILGWPAGHRLGMRGEDFVHPQHRRAAAAAGEAMLTDPSRPQTLELRLLDSHGSWRWVETTLTNLLDEPTVAGIVINHRLVEERKELEDELIHRAFHDPLTGLANRGQLRGRLKGFVGDEAARAPRRAVLFIDLDDFKTVNDGFGHDAGDRLLVEVGDRLTHSVCESDLVARLGGDEFAVLVENRSASEDRADTVARRVMEALQEPFEMAGHRTRVTASIGIARQGASSSDPDLVLVQADIAMYHAKANGKNRYVDFSDEMQRSVLHRLDVETGLREALVADQFRVFFQPIVKLGDRSVAAVEALVRWEHPTLGLLEPNDFLSVAEETGLIVPLGKVVLREVCRQLRIWQDRGHTDLVAGVNLSAGQLRDEALVDDLRLLAAEAGINPSNLVVEVTEGALIADVRGATRVLQELSSLGVTIAIDDFGTGYSSLSHLRQFPVDILKIDKAFVGDLCTSGVDSTLVRSVLAIAREFGHQVVAEGIEVEQQEEVLFRLGCEYGQGFRFAHPVPARGIDAMLERAPALHTHALHAHALHAHALG
jgi:diguanylate cyclase (GGDEF)-like protein/PAS domain S-box-containing protein